MSVNDSILLEKRGVPTATFSAGKFSTLGQLQAKALGIGWLPILAPPYPFALMSNDAVRKAADALIDEVIYVLTQPSEKLEKDYLDRHIKGPNPLRAPDQGASKPAA